MALAALANFAAATAAGYTEIALDRGASYLPATRRWLVTLEKMLTGEPASEATIIVRAVGESDTQANARTQAVAALNGQRLHRYGADTGTASKGPKGGQHTIDVT